MQIIPVLDLMNGQVVRGIAGRRKEYRPIVSRLIASAEPMEVARAFRNHFGLTQLYIADLDAIAGCPPALPLYEKLLADDFHLWVDAGLSPLSPRWPDHHASPPDNGGGRGAGGEGGMHMAEPLASAGVQTLIAGLESLPGPDYLQNLLVRFSESRIVFSLDLNAGQPLGNLHAWNQPDPWSIALEAIELGVRRLLVLDLAGVGVNQGIATEDLCQKLRSEFPHLEITTGGGVRCLDDLRRLQTIGVDYVLVASALHDGRLTANDLTQLA